MAAKCALSSIYLVCLLAACQTALPPINPAPNTEFTLVPDQTATIKGTELTVRFNAVLSDDRCPREIECASSGPVTVSLSIQQGDSVPFGSTLQTFTDREGRAPGGEFESVENSVEVGDYVVRVVGVLPYPQNLSGIKASDYQATFIVIPH